MVIQQYYSLFIFIAIALGLVTFILFLSYWRSSKNTTNEKKSAYECGFNPIMKSTDMFNIRFYIVSILFLIFDVEIAFLFPWAVTLEYTKWLGFGSMFLFISVMVVAFIYEWKKGGLEWE